MIHIEDESVAEIFRVDFHQLAGVIYFTRGVKKAEKLNSVCKSFGQKMKSKRVINRKHAAPE